VIFHPENVDDSLARPRLVEIAAEESPERFKSGPHGIVRVLRRRDGQQVRSLMAEVAAPPGPASADAAEQAWLRSRSRPEQPLGVQSVRVVDLFSGCGGLTLGVEEAARAVGRSIEPLLAVDADADASRVYAHNFPAATTKTADIGAVFDGSVGARLTSQERMLARSHPGVDIMLGGPPCQGHSDLNNKTRRRDDKNQLYMSMIRAAEVLRPKHLLVENVPGALRDRSSVVQRAADALLDLGYDVTMGVVDMSRIGVPQRRRRLLLLASCEPQVDVNTLEVTHARAERTLDWAIRDLEHTGGAGEVDVMDQAAVSAATTRQRMAYLFERDLYDLPNSERPPCHAKGGHSYSSIYGRLAWDRPAQTITRGFYSMCMGRYVHPSKQRTLTAREAARLQYIPDWFDFGATRRNSLALMIGNAVPSRLAYAVATGWFR
jgi:DNA (cytosine-5)-methyltransferase 1